MVIPPLCSRRRRVSRRTNLLDCDVGHVASYLCAAKILINGVMAKQSLQKNSKYVYSVTPEECSTGMAPEGEAPLRPYSLFPSAKQ